MKRRDLLDGLLCVVILAAFAVAMSAGWLGGLCVTGDICGAPR